jgi:hypothetical protein
MTPLQRRFFRVVWVALFVATCIYGVIDYVVIGPLVHLQSFEQEIRSPIVIGLYGAAVMTFFGALALGASTRREIFIARLALFESVAIFGLVASFVTNDWRLFFPAWALAALGFVQTLPPTAEYTPGP